MKKKGNIYFPAKNWLVEPARNSHSHTLTFLSLSVSKLISLRILLIRCHQMYSASLKTFIRPQWKLRSPLWKLNILQTNWWIMSKCANVLVCCCFQSSCKRGERQNPVGDLIIIIYINMFSTSSVWKISPQKLRMDKEWLLYGLKYEGKTENRIM